MAGAAGIVTLGHMADIVTEGTPGNVLGIVMGTVERFPGIVGEGYHSAGEHSVVGTEVAHVGVVVAGVVDV